MSSGEKPPFGPLTYEDWARLATSFHDDARLQDWRWAIARGIDSSNFMGVQIEFVKRGVSPIKNPYKKIAEQPFEGVENV